MNQIAKIWKEKKLDKLKKIIFRQVMLIVGFTLFAVICAEIFGRKMLEILYKITLTEYRMELLILLLAGGAIALINLASILITTLRHQKYLIYLMFSGCLIMFVAGPYILRLYNIAGLCVLYAIDMVILCFVTGGICKYCMSKHVNDTDIIY